MQAFTTSSSSARLLQPLTSSGLAAYKKKLAKGAAQFIDDHGFAGKANTLLPMPGAKGIDTVLFGLGGDEGATDPFVWAAAAKAPKGTYKLPDLDDDVAFAACLGWALASYSFSTYKADKPKSDRKLVWPKNVDKKEVERLFDAISLGRDLINTPANDMGPAELEGTARKLARQHKANMSVITGTQLEKKNFPAVYAVGKGSDRAPRLIDIRWGNPKHKKLTLVGKGVCFDTGGYNLKPGGSMLLMKKDMGGAAKTLALAHLVMSKKLPVRLRVLVPAVENSVSGGAMRPSDVIQSRKGLTIEVGNTDAEGRLILCDALTEACREKPDLLLDFATLTGAARVALGTEMPAVFSTSDEWADAVLHKSVELNDPLWRMPLFQPYKRKLKSAIADTNNIASGSYGGAITAALFLQQFVDDDVNWAHEDLMAYNIDSRPGRPKGGEVMGIRATYAALCERYGTSSKARGPKSPAKKTAKKTASKKAAAKKKAPSKKKSTSRKKPSAK